MTPERRAKEQLLRMFKFCPICGEELIDSPHVPDCKECETHGIGGIQFEGNAISGYVMVGYSFNVY